MALLLFHAYALPVRLGRNPDVIFVQDQATLGGTSRKAGFLNPPRECGATLPEIIGKRDSKNRSFRRGQRPEIYPITKSFPIAHIVVRSVWGRNRTRWRRMSGADMHNGRWVFLLGMCSTVSAERSVEAQLISRLVPAST